MGIHPEGIMIYRTGRTRILCLDLKGYYSTTTMLTLTILRTLCT